MKKALRTELYRTIKNTWTRFFAILLIVALGVAFFAGLRTTQPDMQLSADQFYDRSNLFDIWIMGTLGLTDDDITAIKKIDGVKEVMPSYSHDLFCETDTTRLLVKMIARPEQINQVTIKEGRLPEKSGECLADAAFTNASGYKIGDTITVAADAKEELTDIVKRNTYKIVGIGSMSYYLSLERGNSSIGSGSINGFLIIPFQDFAMEAYSDIYVTTDGTDELNTYSKEYEENVKAVQDRIKKISDAREEARYQEIMNKGNQKIADGEKQIADGESEIQKAENKLSDGKKKLDDAKKELDSGSKKITDGEIKLADAKKKIADGEVTLQDADKKLNDSKIELQDAEKTLAEKRIELDNGWSEYRDGVSKLSDGKNQLEAGKQKLYQSQDQVNNGRQQLEQQNNALNGMAGAISAGSAGGSSEKQTAIGYYFEYAKSAGLSKQNVADILSAAGYLSSLQTGYDDFYPTDSEMGGYSTGSVYTQILITVATAGKSTTDADSFYWSMIQIVVPALQSQAGTSKQSLDEAQAKIDDGWKQIHLKEGDISDAETELGSVEVQLQTAESIMKTSAQKIKDGWAEYEKGLVDYQDGKAELEANRLKVVDAEAELADAKQKWNDGNIEYQDGVKEYESAKTEADQKLSDARSDIADAKIKIADAKKQLADLEYPDWYVLNRNYNQTYVEYKEDSERIGAIGKVFPAIFFLVAALVSLTTMTRMVEDERTQIGTLKALGYSNQSIAGKYMIYAIAASVLGSLLGLILGQKLLPLIIINAYKILYTSLPDILTPINLEYAAGASIAAIACTSLATWLACYRELLSSPAVLMRPVSPKAGKRVLLERITFLWKRLNFTTKATIRNLLRYKKRFFMTIFGVGGCMALLIVGFGLQDAIYVVGEVQYKSIISYDASVTLKEEATDKEKQELRTLLTNDKRVVNSMFAYQHLMEAEGAGKKKDVYLVVPEFPDQISQYISLQKRTTKAPIKIGDHDAVISEKLATMLKLSVGDNLTLKDADEKDIIVKVGAITENYYLNYVYISPEYYKTLYQEPINYNTVLLDNADTSESFQNKMGEEYLEKDGILEITFYSHLSERIHDMLKSMDSVIWVLVVSAGLLAFIVLYNLNNINITERKRELSTLKVLGFYDNEVSSYVLRENIAITTAGTILGIFLGTLLTRYIVLTAEIDAMMFGRKIELTSYLWSILLTFLFAAIVNAVMHFSLKKIDMLEALKSVE